MENSGMEAFKHMMDAAQRDGLDEATRSTIAMFFYSVARSSLHMLLAMRDQSPVALESLDTVRQWLDEELTKSSR